MTPNSFEDLAFKLFDDISKEFNAMYAACDNNIDNAVNSNYRKSRGVSNKLVTRSLNVRIPSN